MEKARALSRTGTVFHLLEIAALLAVIIYFAFVLRRLSEAGKLGTDLATGQDPEFPGAGYIALFGMGVAAMDVLGQMLFVVLIALAGIKLLIMLLPVISGLRAWSCLEERRLRRDGIIKAVINILDMIILILLFAGSIHAGTMWMLIPILIWGVFIFIAFRQVRSAKRIE